MRFFQVPKSFQQRKLHVLSWETFSCLLLRCTAFKNSCITGQEVTIILFALNYSYCVWVKRPSLNLISLALILWLLRNYSNFSFHPNEILLLLRSLLGTELIVNGLSSFSQRTVVKQRFNVEKLLNVAEHGLFVKQLNMVTFGTLVRNLVTFYFYFQRLEYSCSLCFLRFRHS